MKAQTLTHPLDNQLSASNTAAVANPIIRWSSHALTRLRKASAERALRRQLASMDTALLRDIGISEDEIYRVRAQENFTPRTWG